MPVVVAMAYYEHIMAFHVSEAIAIASMLLIHSLSGRKERILTTWLSFGGSNTTNQLYKITSNPKTGASSVQVTIYDQQKAMTMLAVVMAILSVDLPPIFGRRLCKTEEFGMGLMDSGVALITLNSGMSGRKARPWNEVKSFS